MQISYFLVSTQGDLERTDQKLDKHNLNQYLISFAEIFQIKFPENSCVLV